jgi:ribosome-binding factor A
MSLRIEKINELIKQQVAEILTRELTLKPGVLITVSKVDTSKDLRYTQVFVSIFPEKETNYVMTAIKKEMYEIQRTLNKKLSLKPLPKLEFKVDTTEIKADEVERILIDLGKE